MQYQPYAIVSKWREGVLEEEVAIAETFIRDVIESLSNKYPDGMPYAIESMTVKRVTPEE